MFNATELIPSNTDGAARVWTRLHCSRCRYMSEHPGPVAIGDLDRECGLWRAPLGAVTVYRLRR